MSSKRQRHRDSALASESSLAVLWHGAYAGNDSKAYLFKGTNGEDKFDGTSWTDFMYGRGGDDVLWGMGGDDYLYGGKGDDKLFGQTGINRQYGGAGDDWLYGGGRNYLVGGTGNDEFDVSRFDIAIGGKGNDVFNIWNNRPTIRGGGGYDVVKFDLQSKNFVASYEDDALLLRTHYNGFYKPQFLMSDTTIEKIVWKDFEIDPRRVSTPEITNLHDGEVKTDPISRISGTASPFARIRIMVDGMFLGQTAADAQGRWTLKVGTSDAIGHFAELVAIADYGNFPSKSSTPVSVDVNIALPLIDITSSQGVVLVGERAFEGLGSNTSYLGDVNGDGYGDLLVSASLSGVAYVIFGGQRALGDVSDDVSYLMPATMPFAQGLEVNWTVQANLVWQVAGAVGDFNGDGVNDILLGSFSSNAAIVLYGGKWDTSIGGADEHMVLDVSQLPSEAGIFIEGGENQGIYGRSMAAAGDFNGDGIDDLIVGTYNFPDTSAFIVFGAENGPGEINDGKTRLLLSEIEESQGLQITGLDGNSEVFGAGDVNGDGLDDVIVKTNHDSPTFAIIYGSDGLLGEAQDGRRILDVGTLAQDQGFYVDVGTLHDWDRPHVTQIGDMNGDGFDDIALAARGNVTVIYGATHMGDLVDDRRVVDPRNLGEDQGFTLLGGAWENTELKVSSAGDFNGDGLDDLLVSRLHLYNYHYKTFLVFGSSSAPASPSDGSASRSLINLPTALGREYQTADIPTSSSAGDLNGDGFDDIVIGDPNVSSSTGRTYIVYGYDTNTSSSVTMSGTSAAEILRGGAMNDILDGHGGADIFRGGAGDDIIRIGDAGFWQIRAGNGRNDTVEFDGAGIVLDARDFDNSRLRGIEAFDLTGTGDNTLILTAFDVFHLSPNRNSAFSAAESGNSLVVRGDHGDTLRLIDHSDAEWTLSGEDVGLDGSGGGAFDIYHLVDGADILASVAVGGEITLLH